MEDKLDDKENDLPLFFTHWNQIYAFVVFVLIALISLFFYLTNKYQWLP